MRFKTIIEPFKIKMVEPILMTTEQERKKFLQAAYYNPFLLRSEHVLIDLLTDSGTSAMSMHQWGAMLQADEAYAGAQSWERMRQAIEHLTGFQYIFPVHQGRAAERILYGVLGGKGKVFLSNAHFDTTRANIEATGAQAIDCPLPEVMNSDDPFIFKGNLNITTAQQFIKKYGPKHIGAIILTVTNNTMGGLPVSMENARAIRQLCDTTHIPFVLDACRIAENTYFIRHYEQEYAKRTYESIAREMFRLTDGCIMSAKKDGLANMGGFLALKNEKLAATCMQMLITTEGYVTYGGLSGRDMEAIAVGLQEVFEPHYLLYRIRSTAYLGEGLNHLGVPVLLPIGGHAVYIDAKKFYPHIPVDQFPGQALVCTLYLLGGIRCCEIGSVMFGKKDKKGNFIPAPMELVRLAIPRRVYTQSHIDYVIEVFGEALKQKDKACGLRIIYEPPVLRHFTARFELANKR